MPLLIPLHGHPRHPPRLHLHQQAPLAHRDDKNEEASKKVENLHPLEEVVKEGDLLKVSAMVDDSMNRIKTQELKTCSNLAGPAHQLVHSV